jgi:hypothetical protein
MSVPTFSGPYTGQDDVVDVPVGAFDVSVGWTGAKRYEVAALPPGFAFDGLDITGTPLVQMFYTLFIRGVNDEGPGDWAPLRWDATGGAASARTLWGLSLAFQNVHASGSGAVLFFKVATNEVSGVLLINDIARDGSASDYDASFRKSQIVLNGVANAFVRATVPGWEIIIDTSA